MSTRSSKPARLSFKLEVEDEDKLEMGVEKGVREMKRCWVISFGAKTPKLHASHRTCYVATFGSPCCHIATNRGIRYQEVA
jgi:hypothetical protein